MQPPESRIDAGLKARLSATAEFAVVAVCTVLFILAILSIGVSLLTQPPGMQDSIEYWAAGHQLIAHANPYDPSEILKLELTAGFPAGVPAQMVPNLPPALALAMPLGLFSPKAAELIWVLLIALSLAASVEMIRTLYGRPKNLLHLLAYAFAPVLSCLVSGQISIFLLLGLALFLRWHHARPFYAGVALWLCLLKPHLFLPFGVALLLWIFSTRSYRILAGAALALAFTSGVAAVFAPQAWRQYSAMMNAARVDRLPIPCVSILFRQLVYPHTFWVQCLPAAVGCAWAAAYYLKRRDRWNWIENGAILVLVSVLVAPYSWFMDQAVLLPALLGAAYGTRSRSLVALLALITAAIEISAIRGAPLYSPFYLWTAPAWLLWYLAAARSHRATASVDLTEELGAAQA